MRSDMYKVIVERPRRGGITTKASRLWRDAEDRPGKIGMRRGYRSPKWLNENLAPLKRWLAAQAGRPWDAVYGDLCRHIDRRNTVQAHIFAHIDQFVSQHTEYVDDRVWVRHQWHMEVLPVEATESEMYVHPVTRLLCVNHDRMTWKKRRDAEAEAARRARDERRRILSESEQLRKLGGIWYRVVFESIPPAQRLRDSRNGSGRGFQPQVWDTLRRRFVGTDRKASTTDDTLFGSPGRYAKTKRQLSKAELRQHGLSNDHDAGTSRRRRFWRLQQRTQEFVASGCSAVERVTGCEAPPGPAGVHRIVALYYGMFRRLE